MSVWEIILLSVALAMDACAVAMTNGMADSKMPHGKALLIGVLFGFFQFLMPLIGYFITGVIADAFLSVFEAVSAWISFGLLAFLGIKMLIEGIREGAEARRCRCENEDGTCSNVSAKLDDDETEKLPLGKLLMQAVATSIDALAVGVSLQMAAISPAGLAMGVWGATATIGVVTLALSFGAVFLGKLIGNKLADKAEILGGIVLIAIGLKILIEGLL